MKEQAKLLFNQSNKKFNSSPCIFELKNFVFTSDSEGAKGCLHPNQVTSMNMMSQTNAPINEALEKGNDCLFICLSVCSPTNQVASSCFFSNN